MLPAVEIVTPPIAVDYYPDPHDLITLTTVKLHDARMVTSLDCMLCLPKILLSVYVNSHLVQSLGNVSIPSAYDKSIVNKFTTRNVQVI